MIFRISLAILVIRIPKIRPFYTSSTANAFIKKGTGVVRFKGVNSITRPFLSTSDGRNLQQEDKIKGLEDKIAEHERDLAELKRDLSTVVDSGERTAIRNQMTSISNQMTSIRNDITALRQQGTFASPISVIFSNPLNINLFAQSLSTTHLLTFRFGDVAR